MSNLKEELFERDAHDSQSDGFNTILNPESIQSNSGSTSLSYSSLATPDFEDKDEIYFPSYDGEDQCYDEAECDERTSFSETASSEPEAAFTPPIEHSEDDITVRAPPFMAVDYLSHDWSEEDLWSSWKYIRSERKTYPNGERLENASWRTWGQKRGNLKTVSPETVKWLKDHDVTWLYGPLQPGSSTMGMRCSLIDSSQASTSLSNWQSKKPILKKPGLSELMIRRSGSPMSLLRHSASAAEAQKSQELAASTDNSFTFTLPKLMHRSTTSNISSTPNNQILNARNVHFHELVEQCIALPHLSDDEPEYHSASDLDDDVVIIRALSRQKQSTQQRVQLFTSEKAVVSATIGRLPHATLKGPSEVETATEKRAMDNGTRLGLGISKLLASNIERHSISSLFLDGSDSDDEDEEDDSWRPPACLQNRRDSVQMFHAKLESIKMHTSDTELSKDSSFLYRPILKRRNEEISDVLLVSKVPAIEGRDASTTIKPTPYRSQLASFSFGENSPSTRRACFDETIDAASRDDEGWSENIDISPGTFDDFGNSSDISLDCDIPPAIALSSTKTALLSKVMEEFWVIFNEWEIPPGSSLPNLSPPESSLHESGMATTSASSLNQQPSSRTEIPLISSYKQSSPDSCDPAKYYSYIRHELPKLVRSKVEKLVRSQQESDAASLISELVPLIHDSQEEASIAYQSSTGGENMYGILSDAFAVPPSGSETPFGKGLSWSLRTLSDSGYGSEDHGDSWRVRDTSQMGEEKEKGFKNWEVHLDAWDELDEAVAWEKVF